MRHRYSKPGSLALGAFLLLSCAACPSGDRTRDAVTSVSDSLTEAEEAPVLPGLEVLLRDSLDLVRGQRVGFLTNQSAVTHEGESGIDLLHADSSVNLVALFGPEHGLRGGVEGGVEIESDRDAATGLPVFSLYGDVQRPTPEMLEGIDVLLFDMQDIGARPYTFVWTMAMAMEAAAGQNIPFVVLDRPNPITSTVEGPLMEMEMRDVAQAITGYYPVPLRHGLTTGELARYINEEYDIGVDLSVVPAAGWRGDMWFDETGLPWINPSPNIRSLEAALNYSGLVLFEATNLSVGRGTDAPFSYIGAPWLDTEALLERVAEHDLAGVALSAVELTPEGEGWVPFQGENVQAVRLDVEDRDAFRPVWTALVLLTEIRDLHPDQFEILNSGFTQMMGSTWAREQFEAGASAEEIWQRWEEELAEWRPIADRYRLYPQ